MTKSRRGPTAAEPRYRSPDERRAEGKLLRESVPRELHGTWKAPKDRRDPIDLIEQSDQGRIPELLPVRHRRMLESPFAFFRGTAILMAADLAVTPTSGIRVQACGDAHLMNFGGFATPERRIVFDINDFDETLPAPWEWDLKRLAASVTVAGRHIRLSETDAARAVRAAVRSYREHMADYSSMRALDVWYDSIDVDRYTREVAGEDEALRERIEQHLAEVRKKSTPEFLFPKLVGEAGALPRILDDPPLIFHPAARQAPGAESQYRGALARYRDSLPDHVRRLFDRFHFCDLAMKVVGVGSVGARCALVLFMAGPDDPIFLQVKEAGTSVLEAHAGKGAHEHQGQRIVQGQHLMQSASDLFLGWTKGEDGRDYYVRQLRDMKISVIIEDFDAGDLRAYARMCGWALARAHARSGDAALISGYMGTSEAIDDAIGDFAFEYADQVQKDYRAFARAVRQGRLAAAA